MNKSTLFASATLCLAMSPLMAATPDRPGYLDVDKHTGTTYLEQVTPAGSVPAAKGNLILAPAAVIQDSAIPARVTETQETQKGSFDPGAVDAFASAYRRAGSPRIAVYFNRELSDEVREKVTSDRRVWEDNLNIKGVRNGSERGELNINSKSMAYDEGSTGITGMRDDPSESWKWEFEDNVTQTLLNAGANVVDRSTIFRLTSAKNGNSDGYAGGISTNLNEMRALEKYADILVELLVVPSSRSSVGYNFKATAKYVKTGRVVGSSFVDGRSNPNPVKTQFVASSEGYSKQTTQEIPSISDLSQVLSQKLMRVMSKNLSKR